MNRSPARSARRKRGCRASAYQFLSDCRCSISQVMPFTKKKGGAQKGNQHARKDKPDRGPGDHGKKADPARRSRSFSRTHTLDVARARSVSQPARSSGVLQASVSRRVAAKRARPEEDDDLSELVLAELLDRFICHMPRLDAWFTHALGSYVSVERCRSHQTAAAQPPVSQSPRHSHPQP